jgi:regulation of enolase protein 1 (concanavalin A-like superfamily)
MNWSARGAWLNEPPTWQERDGTLEVTTGAATDFWRETHYGFTRDSGHFLAFEAPGEFTAQVRVRADYQALYDQAGLMVRVDERRWVKAGIELSDGHAMLSSVLTMGQSDWATAPYPFDASDFWLRATVAAGVLRLQVSADGASWPLVRLAPFAPAERYRVGPMCCTPERAGLVVRFSDFRLTAPLGKSLHDLT